MPRIDLNFDELKAQIEKSAAEQEALIGNDPWGGEGRYDWENRYVYKANNGMYVKTYRVLNKKKIQEQFSDPRKEKFVGFNLNYQHYLLSVSAPEVMSKNADHCLAFKINKMDEIETDEVYSRGEKKGKHKTKMVKPRLDANTYRRLLVIAGNHYGATETRNGLTKIVKLMDGSVSYAQSDKVISWVLDVDRMPDDHELCIKMVKKYEEQIGMKCCSLVIHKKFDHCTIQALFVLQKETKKEYVRKQMTPVLEIWNKMYPDFKYDHHCTQMNIKNPFGFDRDKSSQSGGTFGMVIMDNAETMKESHDAYFCMMKEDWSKFAIDIWSSGKKAVYINDFMSQKEWSPLIEDDSYDQELQKWLEQNEVVINDSSYEVQEEKVVKTRGNKKASFKEGSRDHWVFLKRGTELVSKIILNENRAPTYEELLDAYTKANQECVQKTLFGQHKGPLPDHQLKSQALWASKQPVDRWREWCGRIKESRSQIHHAQTLIKCFIHKTNDKALMRKMTFASLGKQATSRASSWRYKSKDIQSLQTDLVDTYTWIAEQEDRQSMFTHQMEVLFDHAHIPFTPTCKTDKVMRVLNSMATPTRRVKSLVLQEVSKVQENQNRNNFRSFLNTNHGLSKNSDSFKDHVLQEYEKTEEELKTAIKEEKDIKDWEKNLISNIQSDSEKEIFFQNREYNNSLIPSSSLSTSIISPEPNRYCFDTDIEETEEDIHEETVNHIPVHIQTDINAIKDVNTTPITKKENNISMYTPNLDTPRKEQGSVQPKCREDLN